MRETKGTALVVIALIFAGIVLLSYLSSTDAELSRYNSGWNGTSSFYDHLERDGGTAITTYSVLDSAPPDTLILVEPYAVPRREDMDTIRQFVRDGGTLIIIAKGERANTILESVGSSIRINDVNLSSVDMEYADPRMPIAYTAQDHYILKDVKSIALNQPSIVTGGQSLLKTSLISWVDANNNGIADEGEKLGQKTVMANETIEQGEILVLADSGILINSMDFSVSERDNNQFRKKLGISTTLAYDTTVSKPFLTHGVLQAVTGAKSTTVIKIIAILLITGIICVAYARKIF
jgi:hypothetical protein